MRSTLLILCVVILAPRVAAQAPSLEAVRSDYAKGQYRLASQTAQKMLASALQAPSPSEKYELMMLLGECKLQLKDRIGAVSAFKSAAQNAADVTQLAAAKGNALIIERSSMGRYKSANVLGKEPIDVIAPASRKEAMAALQGELWSQNKSQLDVALRASTLPPIEKVFVPLSNMFCLELAATGDSAQTGKVMRELGQQTYRLMRTEVTEYARKIDQLNLLANSGDGNWGDARRGLIPRERNELKEQAAYLVKLRDRATEYRSVANKLGGSEERWDGLVLDITDALAVAEALFNER